MKTILTIKHLFQSAAFFCEQLGKQGIPELFGVTDGKAVGTYVEHAFKAFLTQNYKTTIGNSASGLDLPDIQTDIKVTSVRQPQSSCPYKDSRQKIYGLGYNLLVFVYEKADNFNTKQSYIKFISCAFINENRTADFQTTTGIRNIISNAGNVDDIFAFLSERMIPGDDITLRNLAEEILLNPPAIGYLTISNALQWRLQYSRIVTLSSPVEGITHVLKANKDTSGCNEK